MICLTQVVLTEWLCYAVIDDHISLLLGAIVLIGMKYEL